MRTQIDVDINVLQQHFGSKLEDAADNLGVCSTALKKLCRVNGLQRWPFRKLQSINKKIQTKSVFLSKQKPHLRQKYLRELCNLVVQKIEAKHLPNTLADESSNLASALFRIASQSIVWMDYKANGETSIDDCNMVERLEYEASKLAQVPEIINNNIRNHNYHINNGVANNIQEEANNNEDNAHEGDNNCAEDMDMVESKNNSQSYQQTSRLSSPSLSYESHSQSPVPIPNSPVLPRAQNREIKVKQTQVPSFVEITQIPPTKPRWFEKERRRVSDSYQDSNRV